MTEQTNPAGTVARLDDEQLDQAAGGGSGAGKVSFQDVKGDPSQWGASAYKRGSFDITE